VFQFHKARRFFFGWGIRLGPQVDFVDDGADLPLALACSR
jgi:hypothetical protein